MGRWWFFFDITSFNELISDFCKGGILTRISSLFTESSTGGSGGIHYEYEQGRKAGSLSPLMRQESAQL